MKLNPTNHEGIKYISQKNMKCTKDTCVFLTTWSINRRHLWYTTTRWRTLFECVHRFDERLATLPLVIRVATITLHCIDIERDGIYQQISTVSSCEERMAARAIYVSCSVICPESTGCVTERERETGPAPAVVLMWHQAEMSTSSKHHSEHFLLLFLVVVADQIPLSSMAK